MITRRALLALLPLGFIARWLNPFKHVRFHRGNTYFKDDEGCLIFPGHSTLKSDHRYMFKEIRLPSSSYSAPTPSRNMAMEDRDGCLDE